MATNNTNITIRMDKELKKEAEAFFGELGLSMTTAINMFIRQALRDKAIPFKITTETDPFYSPSNMKALKKSIKQAEKGQFITKTMQELEDMENN
jgi:DNA-damage-inducible protein J